MKLKQLLTIVIVSCITALASVWGYSKFAGQKTVFLQPEGKLPVNYAGFWDGKSDGNAGPSDFTKAANSTVQAVVHIKTKIPAQKITNTESQSQQRRQRGMFDDMFDQFFDFGPQVIPEQRASGSGVLISEDGYIVTNNHVISNGNDGVADEIMVTMHNGKTYKARVIGKDPSSDLAVLKIDGKSLPHLIYGNSDNLQLGQWVLAVGYPLTLETTVTAGIVSAQGRALGINNRQSATPVESFIQTDAAVNQGNSGGALVTTDGELVGINSAILAPNGYYAGYSFAIPVNLVKRIVQDLIEFGDVKRGFLGISYTPTENLTDEQKNELGVKDGGVYVANVSPDGAASAAGIKKGDIITKVNDKEVSSGLAMSASISQNRPGDKVPVVYTRNGKSYNATIVLKAQTGNFAIVNTDNLADKLGAELETISSGTAAKMNIDGGVQVKKLSSNSPLARSRMEESFIITSVNGKDIKNTKELAAVLNSLNGTVQLEGVYPGYDGKYTYPLNLGN